MKDPVATVNGAPIDDKALAATMQSLAQEQYRTTLEEVAAEARADLRTMAIERLIARELIYQAALAEGVVASAEEIAAEKSRIVRMAGNPKDFWTRLAERGMDEAAFDRMVRKDVTVEQMTARKLAAVPPPEEEEIVRFFRQHPDKLRQPERVRVSHILLPVEADGEEQAVALARELKEKAREGDFRALAKQHSACPSAPGGGELGYIRREDVDPAFAEAAFGQPVDEVGEPVKTPFGIHLIKVTDREIPGPPTLEESRGRIIDPGFQQPGPAPPAEEVDDPAGGAGPGCWKPGSMSSARPQRSRLPLTRTDVLADLRLHDWAYSLELY